MKRGTGLSTGFRPLVAFGLLAVSAVAGSAHAGQLGHYFPWSFSVRDYVMPDKGVYAAVYTIYYDSSSLRDGGGCRSASRAAPCVPLL